MKNEKIISVLNDVMIDKLDGIVYDIKCYVNSYASIAQSLNGDESLMCSSDMEEIKEIRKRCKQLSINLKNK